MTQVTQLTPRVLRITFDLHVPVGLRRKVQGHAVEVAVGAITLAVRAVLPQAFPWANRMTVSHEWVYRWAANSEEVGLAATGLNG